MAEAVLLSAHTKHKNMVLSEQFCRKQLLVDESGGIEAKQSFVRGHKTKTIKLESLVEQKETAGFSVGRSLQTALLTVHAIAGPPCSKENKNSC